MITDILAKLYGAFTQVVKLVSGGLGQGFEAVGELSSNVF